MAVFVGGLVGMILFYLVILVVGLLSARKSSTNAEDAMLGGRKFGIILGSLTLTATWYGGGFVNGTAEAVANPYYGLVWSVAPLSYGLSMAVGGVIVGRTMRERRYFTVIDPLQERYGRVMGLILMAVQLIGDIIYIATILLALGSTVSVILGVGLVSSTIGSVTIVVFYTFFGGLTSVVWTDLVQLPCILLGLLISIPFAVSNPAVSDITVNTVQWTGVWPTPLTSVWIDTFVILLCGAIPVQGYLQRALAAKTPNIALITCVLGSLGVLLFAIPPVFIGAIGAKTDWYQTEYADYLPPISANGTNASYPYINYSLTLPLVIRYLTPTWVGVFALGAVSAAVMSSMDSSFIAIASEISCNFYKVIIRPKAGDKEMVWVLRVTVVLAAAASTAVALAADSIYALFYLIGDFNGVVMFSQLVCAVHVTNTNTYGSLCALVVGLLLRLGGGDSLVGIPSFIKYPFYSDIYGQLFPYKTFALFCSFLALICVSYFTKFLFEKEILPAKMDFFHCFQSDDVKREEENISLKAPEKGIPTKI